MAAGRKATKRFVAKRCCTGSVASPENARANRARYSQQTARIAPSWITMSKTLPFSSFSPRRSETRMRCPVEEIGRNSVRPSTTPRRTASSRGSRGIAAYSKGNWKLWEAERSMNRREAMRTIAGAALIAAPALHAAQNARAIPSTGESLPPIGLGTWITFDVPPGETRHARGEVLRAFFESGGRLVDSSPMYGESESLVGEEYARIGRPAGLFAATKVWTVGTLSGRRQIEKSHSLWRLPRFDLLQVHNMLDWQGHLATLKEMKAH